jgi:nicotinate-nucleotide adenylyltransferase
LKIGLYFGSFNPVHVGHLAIANYIHEFTDLQQIWFVVSPQNPLKKKKNLLADFHRLEMINLAIGDSTVYKASNIEFSLPKPSRTIDTLAYLYDKYPNHEFSLIMGADNLITFHKWKNYQAILKNYKLFVYPRHDTGESQFDKHPSVVWIQAPLIEISSSFIRESILDKKSMEFFVPKGVWEYIREMHFYEK